MVSFDGTVSSTPVPLQKLQELKDAEEERTMAAARSQREQLKTEQQKQQEEKQARQAKIMSDITDNDGNVVIADVEGEEDAAAFIIGEYNNRNTGVKRYEVVTLNDDGTVAKVRLLDASKVSVIEKMSADEYRQALNSGETSDVEDKSGEGTNKPSNENGDNAGYSLSNQTAGNGEHFYQDENGNIDLANIPDEVFKAIGYTSAPFRLTESMVTHVLTRHANELGISTPQEAIDFIRDVMTNFDHVRLGDNGALVFSIENGRKKTGRRAITVFINDGGYYGLKTSGYEKMSGLKKRPLLWERGVNETSTTDAVTANVATNESQLNSGQSGNASNQSNVLESKDTKNSSNDKENSAALTLEDGTIVPMLEDGNPDFSKLTARQTAELYDTQFGEDAKKIIGNFVSESKKALDKANNMKVKGENFVEQKASKEAKEKAIADAKAAYDSAKAISDAYKERLLAKEENTREGRMNLIDKAKRKFARLKSAVKDDAAAVQQLYHDTVGSLLHHLYDSTGVDVFDDAPNTVEEYVASSVAPYSLNYEGTEYAKGVQQETGLSRADFAKRGWLAKEGKGKTIDALVHELWDGRPSNLDNIDTQDIRNALLDLIRGDQTAFDLRNYIQNERIAQAENALEEQRLREEDAKREEKEGKVEEKKEEESAPATNEEQETKNAVDAQTEPPSSESEQQLGRLEEGNHEGMPELPADATEDNPFGGDVGEDYPFSKRDTGKQGNNNNNRSKPRTQKELEEDAKKNHVDDVSVVDNIIGKKLRKSLERIAKMMGTKIVYLYTDVDNNGWYDEKSNTVYLTLDSSIMEGVQFIFGHEMTHEMKAKNPEAFEELKSVIKDAMGEDAFNAQADITQEIYKDHGASYWNVRSDIEEEVVADEIGKMLRDFNYARTLAFRMSHPLLAKMHDILLRIKRAFTGTKEYQERIDNIIRSIEQAYVATANGTFESSTTGERFSLKDEEKVKRIEKLRESKPIEITGNEVTPSEDLKQYKKNAKEYGKTLQGTYVNEDTGVEVQLQRGRRNGGVNEVLQHDYKDIPHLQSVAAIPQIIQKSIYIDSEKNTDKEKNPSVSEYQYYVCGLKIGGVDYTVRSVFALDNNGNRYYDHKLTDIEKGKLLDLIDQGVNDSGFDATSSTELTTANNSVGKDRKLNSILQINRQESDENVKYSLRQKPEPEKKGIGYKVFVLKDGKLYPPMVANPNGAETPVGVWLDADAAPIAGESKTGRPQVKQGGKGTQGGGGKLAYRPGWHLGVIPYALQFNRKDAEGNKTLFPNNFVFAEVEYAADKNYQEEARQEGINANGKYQHSLAGLKHLPTDGYYIYRTNPNPKTDPWVITGAMKVNRILTRAEQADLVRKAGREPQQIQEGDIVTDDVVNSINQQIANTPKFSLRVYHGSGADFSEFDFDHMGEGAGSQAFGWGGYVTSSEKIGKSYAQLGAGNARAAHGGIDFNRVDERLQENERFKDFDEYKRERFISKAEQYIKEAFSDYGGARPEEVLSFAVDDAEADGASKEVVDVLKTIKVEDLNTVPRNLYEVEIPDDNGNNYLDWYGRNSDIPKQMINHLSDELGSMGWKRKDLPSMMRFTDGYDNIVINPRATGADLYEELKEAFKSQKEASELLSRAGFVGIKYPAGTIMGGTEEGDMNYVIFKPEDMKIVEHTKFSLKSNVDNQGNPLNADGTLKTDKIKSVADLTDEDFLHPSRNIQMPTLPKKVADAIGVGDKPVIIKKNIFERNNMRHKDVTPEQSKAIFNAALYNPDLYGQNQKTKRPYNWVLINTKDEKGKNRTVLLEVNPNKDNVEIVHWYFVNERNLELIKKQAIREGGQVLILPSEKSEEVGGLSNLTDGLSSANVDNSAEMAKENGEKNDGDNIKFSLRTYHGTGANFDAFDSSHALEGEGSEVYGHGVYVTNSGEIGKDYAERAKKSHASTIFVDKMKPLNDTEMGLFKDLSEYYREDYDFGRAKKDVLEDIEDSINYFSSLVDGYNKRGVVSEEDANEKKRLEGLVEEYKAARPRIEAVNESDLDVKANRYDVEIPDDNGQNYLKWHGALPISLDRGKLGKDILDFMLKRTGDVEIDEWTLNLLKSDINGHLDNAKNGEQLYKAISQYMSDVGASKLLSNNGIVGMKYRAGMIHGGAKKRDYNYVIYKDSDAKIVGNTKFSLKQTNDKFNSDLKAYVDDGIVPQNSRFELGFPSEVLREAGFPMLPISMRVSLLNKKAGMERHPFSPTDLYDMVSAIQKPIAIFQYSKPNMRNLIVDLTKGEKHFLVGVTLDYRKGELAVNSVSGLFPKENHEWIKWIQDGKAIRIDQKEKVLSLIDSLRTNPEEAERIGLNLNSVANIVKGFDNSNISDENLRSEPKFSLRIDRYEHDLSQWKKDNNLPKDAERPVAPIRATGESAADFLKRVREYRKQMALWKTAPRYEQHLLTGGTAQGEFNREMQRGAVLTRIAIQDSMLAIRKAQEAILKEVGADRLNMAEDAYTAENRSHGKGKNEFEEYNDEFLQPLRKAYNAMKKLLGGSYDNVRVYMIAKHGLERDAHIAFKKTAWLASGLLVPMVNVMLMSMFGDDDKDKYWQFSKWDRRNNFIMWAPFTHDFIKIPLAQEFRGFYGVGDMIASKLWGGDKAEESWSDYAEDLLGQVVGMLPLDPIFEKSKCSGNKTSNKTATYPPYTYHIRG